MTDVNPTPLIRCDNCGFVQEKERPSIRMHADHFRKPRDWGSLTIESGRSQQGYPQETLRFVDLCPSCACAAHDAAGAALEDRRGEK